MSTLRLQRFAVPAVLKSIELAALVQLMHKEGGSYISDQLDLAADESTFDYDRLAVLLANPKDGYPERLADALHHIHEVADEEGLEAMLDLMEQRGVYLLGLPADASPADVAVRLWLHDPDLVETTHAEKFISRPKSFESWLGRSKGRATSPAVAEDKLRAMEACFDDYFDQRKRGRHSRVFVFSRPEATYFLVRHGLPMDVANRAYDVKQSAQTQLQELLAREQDAERRLKATAALLLTVKAELADVYGDQAWPAYEKYGMDWFEKLTTSAEMVEDAPVQEQPQP